MQTGCIEVILEDLEVLGPAKKDLKFLPKDTSKASEHLQLQYRYLSLRLPEMQRTLRLRSEVIMKMREYLIKKHGFVDIETPTLFRRTPGGAQEFIVPTRQPGNFYSLVQSPQQFKQLLMIGGLDRYFQIARCYRDEGSRPDRQPEFTQVDIEMSFPTLDGIISLIEGLIADSWPEGFPELKIPFPRLDFNTAMSEYGTDKPDTRFKNKIQEVTGILKDVSFPENSTLSPSSCVSAVVFRDSSEYYTAAVKNKMKTLAEGCRVKKNSEVKIDKKGKWITNMKLNEKLKDELKSILKLEENDVVFIAAGNRTDVLKYLGKVRLEFADHLETKGKNIRSSGYNFHWVLDFPLFSVNDEGKLESNHHPFTAPHPHDVDLLRENPENVRGLHYDLVMNGNEIAGGSIRIHDPMLQEEVLKLIGEDSSQLHHLIDALASGCPPHGGIAIGLDRYISLLLHTKSIRDVIAFPKTTEGRDLMSDAPSAVSEKDLDLYHIKVINKQSKC
ncbi:aspartate--tRNA ligase, mitochondrial-like isoform X2 [Artemia franciscana]